MAVLSGVAVLEGGLVVGEIELDLPTYGFPGVFSFLEFEEITEVAVTVWPRTVGGELVRLRNFKHLAKIPG